MRLRTGRPFSSAQRVPFHESSASRSVSAVLAVLRPRWRTRSCPDGCDPGGAPLRRYGSILPSCSRIASFLCRGPAHPRSIVVDRPRLACRHCPTLDPSRLLDHRAARTGFEVQECGPFGQRPRYLAETGEQHPVETHPGHDRRRCGTAEWPMQGSAARARSDAPSGRVPAAPARKSIPSWAAGRRAAVLRAGREDRRTGY